MSFILFTIFILKVFAHGGMVHPPIWQDPNGVIGQSAFKQCATGNCMWFTNETFMESPKPTLPQEARTYPKTPFQNTPWLAPGSAKIYSPCGINGGNPNGCNGGKDCPGGGFGYGPDALNYTFSDVVTTAWKAGSIVEAAWGIIANHGGGYSYRLCKIPPEGKIGLTEECFQKGHLQFAGDYSWIQYGSDKTNRTQIPALRVSKGSTPSGSEWTRNPIPPCATGGGGSEDKIKNCLISGVQFPRPAPGLGGFGERQVGSRWTVDFGFSIVDQLKIPKNLEPGMYALSFRWDCEQTPQVWNTCSNIKISVDS